MPARKIRQWSGEFKMKIKIYQLCQKSSNEIYFGYII